MSLNNSKSKKQIQRTTIRERQRIMEEKITRQGQSPSLNSSPRRYFVASLERNKDEEDEDDVGNHYVVVHAVDHQQDSFKKDNEVVVSAIAEHIKEMKQYELMSEAQPQGRDPISHRQTRSITNNGSQYWPDNVQTGSQMIPSQIETTESYYDPSQRNTQNSQLQQQPHTQQFKNQPNSKSQSFIQPSQNELDYLNDKKKFNQFVKQKQNQVSVIPSESRSYDDESEELLGQTGRFKSQQFDQQNQPNWSSKKDSHGTMQEQQPLDEADEYEDTDQLEGRNLLNVAHRSQADIVNQYRAYQDQREKEIKGGRYDGSNQKRNQDRTNKYYKAQERSQNRPYTENFINKSPEKVENNAYINNQRRGPQYDPKAQEIYDQQAPNLRTGNQPKNIQPRSQDRRSKMLTEKRHPIDIQRESDEVQMINQTEGDLYSGFVPTPQQETESYQRQLERSKNRQNSRKPSIKSSSLSNNRINSDKYQQRPQNKQLYDNNSKSSGARPDQYREGSNGRMDNYNKNDEEGNARVNVQEYDDQEDIQGEEPAVIEQAIEVQKDYVSKPESQKNKKTQQRYRPQVNRNQRARPQDSFGRDSEKYDSRRSGQHRSQDQKEQQQFKGQNLGNRNQSYDKNLNPNQVPARNNRDLEESQLPQNQVNLETDEEQSERPSRANKAIRAGGSNQGNRGGKSGEQNQEITQEDQFLKVRDPQTHDSNENSNKNSKKSSFISYQGGDQGGSNMHRTNPRVKNRITAQVNLVDPQGYTDQEKGDGTDVVITYPSLTHEIRSANQPRMFDQVNSDQIPDQQMSDEETALFLQQERKANDPSNGQRQPANSYQNRKGNGMFDSKEKSRQPEDQFNQHPSQRSNQNNQLDNYNNLENRSNESQQRYDNYNNNQDSQSQDSQQNQQNYYNQQQPQINQQFDQNKESVQRPYIVNPEQEDQKNQQQLRSNMPKDVKQSAQNRDNTDREYDMESEDNIPDQSQIVFEDQNEPREQPRDGKNYNKVINRREIDDGTIQPIESNELNNEKANSNNNYMKSYPNRKANTAQNSKSNTMNNTGKGMLPVDMSNAANEEDDLAINDYQGDVSSVSFIQSPVARGEPNDYQSPGSLSRISEKSSQGHSNSIQVYKRPISDQLNQTENTPNFIQKRQEGPYNKQIPLINQEYVDEDESQNKNNSQREIPSTRNSQAQSSNRSLPTNSHQQIDHDESQRDTQNTLYRNSQQNAQSSNKSIPMSNTQSIYNLRQNRDASNKDIPLIDQQFLDEEEQLQNQRSQRDPRIRNQNSQRSNMTGQLSQEQFENEAIQRNPLNRNSNDQSSNRSLPKSQLAQSMNISLQRKQDRSKLNDRDFENQERLEAGQKLFEKSDRVKGGEMQYKGSPKGNKATLESHRSQKLLQERDSQSKPQNMDRVIQSWNQEPQPDISQNNYLQESRNNRGNIPSKKSAVTLPIQNKKGQDRQLLQKGVEVGTFGRNSVEQMKTPTDDSDLAIENERLKTSLFLLNQKLNQVQDTDENVKALRKKNREQEDEMNQLNDMNTNLRSQNASLTTENDELQTEITQLTDDNQEIKNQNEELLIQVQKQESENSMLKKAENTQKKLKEDEVEENQRLQSQLSSLKIEQNALKNQKQSFQKDTNNMAAQQKQVKQENSALKSDISYLQSQIKSRDTAIETLKTNLRDLDNQVEKTDESKDLMKEDNTNLNNKIIQIEEELYEAKQMQISYQRELEQIDIKKYEEARAEEVQKYIVEIQELKYQLNITRTTISQLELKIQKIMSGQAVYIPKKLDKIDVAVGNFINNYPERDRMSIIFLRESEGVYQFGQKRVYVKIEKGQNLLVRVGGGFMHIADFITQYTQEEVAKVQRRDVMNRFKTKRDKPDQIPTKTQQSDKIYPYIQLWQEKKKPSQPAQGPL